MENLNFEGRFANNAAKVDLSVDLFQFEEDGNVIIYSPAFDLSGYGKSVEEAKKSWEVTIEEFLIYTLNKSTLIKELKRLGWDVKESDVKNKSLKRPSLARLITKNDYLAQILDEKTFSKFEETISLPC
jgi:hypothetical protein